MKNVLTKLASARAHIKTNRIKPDGNNSYSGYDYFTPELVSKLVNDACKATNTICLFSTKKDELGYYGELMFCDLDSSESLTTIMRTEKPTIKATNETQQMGGMQTYSKRYALMSLFDIEDNTMDFDSQNNAPKKNNAPAEHQAEHFTTPPAKDDKAWLNQYTDKSNTTETDNWKKVVNALKNGVNGQAYTVADVEKKYKLNKDVRAALQEIVKK